MNTTIRDARIKRDLTQAELAEILGITAPSVSSWERGIAAPRGNKKRAIERALDLAPGTLGTTSMRRGPLKPKAPAATSDRGQNHAEHANGNEAYDE